MVPPSCTQNALAEVEIEAMSSSLSTGTTCAPTRTFKICAVDSCNNTSAAPAVIYSWKVDTTAPQITTTPGGGDLGCNPATIPDDAAVKGQVQATDACSTPIIYVSHVDGGTVCSPTRTFKICAVDSCNNTSTVPAVVYSWKVDNTAPMLSAPQGTKADHESERTHVTSLHVD